MRHAILIAAVLALIATISIAIGNPIGNEPILKVAGQFFCVFLGFWMMLALAAVLYVGGTWSPRPRDPNIPTAKGLCPTCGYDIRATRKQCPECGKLFKDDVDPEQLAKILDEMTDKNQP